MGKGGGDLLHLAWKRSGVLPTAWVVRALKVLNKKTRPGTSAACVKVPYKKSARRFLGDPPPKKNKKQMNKWSWVFFRPVAQIWWIASQATGSHKAMASFDEL